MSDEAKQDERSYFMRILKLRISVRSLLVGIMLIALSLTLAMYLRPLDRGRAIRFATQHLVRNHPEINLQAYTITAPTPPDWFEEWEITFTNDRDGSGFLVSVTGKDLYTGPELCVYIDNAW